MVRSTIGQRSGVVVPRSSSEFRYSASLADPGWGMKNTAALVASVLFCVVIGVAAAERGGAERGFYVGGYVVQSSKDAPRGLRRAATPRSRPSPSSREEKTTQLRRFGHRPSGSSTGYRLTPASRDRGRLQQFRRGELPLARQRQFSTGGRDCERGHRNRDNRFHCRTARRAAVVARLGVVCARRCAVRRQ